MTNERNNNESQSDVDANRQMGEKYIAPLRDPGGRLRQIFEDLLAYAPAMDEDDGWDALAAALDAERPEGMKLFNLGRSHAPD